VNERASFRRGLAAGIAAYCAWGVVPLYWHLLTAIAPVEILAHRAVWGLLAFAAMALALDQRPAIIAALRDRRALAALAAGATLLAINWGIFIWATLRGHLLQASLGYFINPLVSVALGVGFLGERLRPGQLAAIAIAAVGVLRLAWTNDGLPWISLALAGSFGVYGLVRKTAPVGALAGSTIETAMMAPLGAAYLGYLAVTGGGSLGHVDVATTLLLLATGVVTALPLAWFTVAARGLPLSVVGFLQYLAPTGQLLTAVIAFGEPLATARLQAFVLIWAALAVFTVDMLAARRR
jgi:chloramphenicol-sensitive protein RarD